METTIRNSGPSKASLRLFWGFASIVILSIFGAIALEEVLLLGLPFVVLVAFQTIVDYKKLFFLLFAFIPLSTEFYFSSSLATDLPTEPLIAGLMLIYILQVLVKPQAIDGRFWKNSISAFLLLHLLWMVFAMIYSQNQGVSIKVVIAKTWYIATFFFLTGHILRTEKDVKKILWWVMLPFMLSTMKVLAHHATLSFGFKDINTAVVPFFRNHVNYAAILALFIPFVWIMRKWYKRWSIQWWFVIGALGIFTLGVLFAYTRAAYVALFLSFASFWIIRFRLMKWALLAATILIVIGVTYMAQDNKFMDFAPTERTIAHKELEDIVAATYKLEDVSTMERYYRWIAGARMAQDDLWTGYGPGNFHGFYKAYTLNKFTTYVSDNPEKSGIHNYYLMILVEQGLPGMLIFILMSFWVLIKGEQIYHESKEKSLRRDIIAGVLLSTVVIDAFLLMNDLIETDKVGSFFFFNMAVLVNMDLLNRKEKQKAEALKNASE